MCPGNGVLGLWEEGKCGSYPTVVLCLQHGPTNKDMEVQNVLNLGSYLCGSHGLKN